MVSERQAHFTVPLNKLKQIYHTIDAKGLSFDKLGTTCIMVKKLLFLPLLEDHIEQIKERDTESIVWQYKLEQQILVEYDAYENWLREKNNTAEIPNRNLAEALADMEAITNLDDTSIVLSRYASLYGALRTLDMNSIKGIFGDGFLQRQHSVGSFPVCSIVSEVFSELLCSIEDELG